MNKKAKAVLSLVVGVAVILAVGLVLVNQQEDEEKPFVYVYEQQGNSWYALHSLGFWDACEDFDVYCKEYANDSKSIQGKLDLCDRMIADGGTAGLQATVHDNSYDSCLNQFDEPFVNTHGMYNETENFLARITPDIEGYSREAAHVMAEALGSEGKVIITQNAFNPFENLVAETFCEVAEDEYDMECTESVAAGGFPENVLIATSLLATHPDAVGAFNTSSFGPLMWMNALKETNHEPGDIIVIAMDAVEENLDTVRDGWVYALVAQPGYEENYEAVRTLVAYSKGEQIEENQLLPAPVITKDDIGPFYKMVERIKEKLGQ